MSTTASAATYYVNGSGGQYVGAQGTYGIGSNTTGNGSLLSPWATIMKAEGSGSNGDIVYVAATTYVEDQASYHSWVSAKGISWVADGTVIVQGNASGNRVIQISGTTTTSWNGFTFDGQNTKETNITGSDAIANKTFTNCIIKDATNLVLLGTTSAMITFSGGSISGTATRVFDNIDGLLTVQNMTITATTTDIFRSTTAGSGAIIFSGNTINSTASGIIFNHRGSGALTVINNTITESAATPVSFVSLVTAGKSGAVTIGQTGLGNVITYTNNSSSPLINITYGAHMVSIVGNTITANSASQVQSVIDLMDQVTPIVDGNTINTPNRTGAVTEIRIRSTGTTVGAATVSNNIIYSRSTSGYIILIGSDSSGVGDNKMNGTIISGNTIYGSYYYNPDTVATTHGILCGHSQCIISQNYIDGSNYAIVMKGKGQDWTNYGVFNNLIIVGGTTPNSAIYAKGIVNCSAYNNTIYTSSMSQIGAALIQYDYNTEGETYYSTGGIMKNNIVYGRDGYYLINVGSGSDTGFLANNNLYWNDQGLGMDYYFAGAIKTSFLAWQALGYDTIGIDSDPLLTSSSNFNLLSGSPAIDTGTTTPDITSTTTDIAGNPIYGTPDIGAYEYQPPHNLVQATPDTIDIGAGARIYADGMFRDLAIANSVPANLKITPSGGSFTIYDTTTTRPAYLDITNITNWTNTHKTWTESNAQTSNMVTDHAISDLNVSKYYVITITGLPLPSSNYITGINGTTCTESGDAICQSNGLGVLSFEYDGEYSDHIFDMQEDSTSSTGTIILGGGATYWTTDTSPTIALTTDDAAQYQLCGNSAVEGADCTDVKRAWATYTATPTAYNFNAQGEQTLYAQFKDLAGNISETYSDDIIIDTTPPVITIVNPNTEWTAGKTITASTNEGTLTMSNILDSTCDGTLTFVDYASQTFTNGSDNGKKVCYKAVDTAGNITYTMSNTIAGITTGSAGGSGIADYILPIEPVNPVEPPPTPPTPPIFDLSNPASVQIEIQRIQTLIQELLVQVKAMQASQQYVFTKDLKFGTIDSEVKFLQQYLNKHGFIVSSTGPGSANNETNIFGYLTRQAVISFQEKYADEILIPSGFTSGTGFVGSYTRVKLNKGY